MLKVYDYLDEILWTQRYNEQQSRQKLEFYASDLCDCMGDLSEEEFRNTLNRTFKICSALNIPINENFMKIYKYDGDHIVTDWQVSPLGCYLLMLNGNPGNPSVAKVQLYAAFHSKKFK